MPHFRPKGQNSIGPSPTLTKHVSGPTGSHFPFTVNQPLTFHTMLHVLQVAQSNPHQTRVEHKFVLVVQPHSLWGKVEKKYARVARGNLVVTDLGVAKATDHDLVAPIQEDFTVDIRLPFQVAPHSDL